jgi:hypothetical protein
MSKIAIRIVAKDAVKTRFMQAADVFEPFKVLIDPNPLDMSGELKPGETEETVATKIRKAVDSNGGQFSVVAILCGGYSWRDPSVKVISTGYQWELFDRYLTSIGFPYESAIK